MRTVRIGGAPAEPAKLWLKAAFAGRPQDGPCISFVSHELLWRVLTPKRWGCWKR